MCSPSLDDDSPEEGDLITPDHRNFYTVGQSYRWPLRLAKPDVVVPLDDDWEPHVKAHMDRERYWPSVWFLSDHGNLSLLTMEKSSS